MILELFIIVSKHTYICIIYVKGGVLNNYINKYYMQLLKEAVVVGLGTVLVGSVVGAVLGKFFSTNLPTICKEWNKNHIVKIVTLALNNNNKIDTYLLCKIDTYN